MSPEEELYDLACQDMPVSGDEVREALDKFKRAYAHELAERIRMGWDETRGATQASKVMAFAADLIDPGGSK